MFADRSHRAPVARVFLIASLVAAGGALAAGKASPAPADKPGSALLTPAQLSECLAQRDKLRAQTDDALTDKAAVQAGKAEIDRAAAALAEQLPALDRASSDAVGAYNARAMARDRLIDDYEAKVTAYNTKAEAVRASKESYEKGCENRRYDDRDLFDLKKKKK